MMHQLDS